MTFAEEIGFRWRKHVFVQDLTLCATILLPAQIVKVQDGNEFTEEISYFLPMGKAINAGLLVTIFQGLNLDIDIVE